MHNFGTLGQPLQGEDKVHPQIYHMIWVRVFVVVVVLLLVVPYESKVNSQVLPGVGV